jgi:hypothetical protein
MNAKSITGLGGKKAIVIVLPLQDVVPFDKDKKVAVEPWYE